MKNAQPRVQSGVPAGGQWAPARHEEIEGDLDPGAILAQARSAAQGMAFRFPFNQADIDDVASEAVMRIYVAKSNGTKFKGSSHGYVATAVKRTATSRFIKARTGSTSGRNAVAYKEYLQARDRMEQELMRHLSLTEEDAIARHIRAKCNNNVASDFHRRTGTDFLSVDVEDGYRYHERLSFAPGSIADELQDVMDRLDGGNNLAAARKSRMRLWDALAEGVGAPCVAKASLYRWSVTAMREHVKEAGGAKHVAAAWEAGELDAETEKDFFAPFGEIDEEQKRQVADLVMAYPSYADELWSAAAGAAAKPHNKQAVMP